MSIAITLHGTGTARCGDIEATTNSMKSPINKLARLLIDGGADPKAKASITRDGTQCFSLVSLQWWADHAANEPASSTVKFKKFTPMDAAQIYGGQK